MAKSIIPEENSSIKTKEEILTELKKYKKVLNSELYNYLVSLMNLNDSSLEEKFSKEELSLIRSISLFDDITLYNLYYLTKEYYKNHTDLSIDEQINNIKLYNGNFKKGNVLYDLYFNQSYDTRKQEVNLYDQVNDQSYYELLDAQIIENLKNEYRKENPYDIVSGRYGGSATNWQFDHEQKINKLEKELQDIRGRNIPNEQEREQISIVQDNINSLIDYFKINKDGFKQTKDYSINKNKKVLTKEINGIKVYHNIRYM